MRRVPILIALVVAAGFVLLNAVFTVDEREKAMVLQFGQVRDIREQPGLAFKVPFIQNVVYYDSRIQGLDTNELEVTPLDDRRLIVDAFARWRISDVSQFRRAVGVGGMQAATQRLESILTANVREALGSVRSEAVLSADRVGLMNRIRDQSIEEARALGI
jgi:membrane protease subunit HflC